MKRCVICNKLKSNKPVKKGAKYNAYCRGHSQKELKDHYRKMGVRINQQGR